MPTVTQYFNAMFRLSRALLTGNSQKQKRASSGIRCMPDGACDRRNVALKYSMTVGVHDRPNKKLYNQNSACQISFMTRRRA